MSEQEHDRIQLQHHRIDHGQNREPHDDEDHDAVDHAGNDLADQRGKPGGDPKREDDGKDDGIHHVAHHPHDDTDQGKRNRYCNVLQISQNRRGDHHRRRPESCSGREDGLNNHLPHRHDQAGNDTACFRKGCIDGNV